MQASTSQKMFFHTKDKWIGLGLPEKNLDSESSKVIHCSYRKPKDLTYRHCIEYWDDIKQKYKYNHLYRKRILKIKQEELQDSIDDKNKITQLLQDEGEIKAQYVNRSKDIDVRGEGVWRQLNGTEIDTPKEESTNIPSLIETSHSDTEVDIVDDLKKCLFEESENTNLEELKNETYKESVIEQDDHKQLCKHIVEYKHKKLFTVPECLEEEKSNDDLSIVNPTEFELCMKQLHDLEKPEIKEDKKIEEVSEVEDPWCKLQKCQIEKYGYPDFFYFPEKKTVSEVECSEEDFYEKIINNILKKDVRVKGTKIKIKQVLGEENREEVGVNFRRAGVTVRGKDGEYLQGLDLRKEKEIEDEEGKIMKQVLESLVGEWTTMGVFLQELANHSTNVTKDPPLERKQSILQRPLGHLGKNVLKMVSEIVQEDQQGEQTRDLTVELKNDVPQSKCVPQSPLFSKEQLDKIISVSYREKIDVKIQKDKKGKILSKQSATKKELLRVGYDVKSFSTTTEKQNILPLPNAECICGKLVQEELPSQDLDKTEQLSQTYHRGLVELLSGSKYAGSWNRLGMEGCGIYISPGGTAIDGHMSDGVLNGPATVYLPNGMVIVGAFYKGEFHSPKIQFGDGLEYKNKDWEYLKETKKLNKSKIKLSKPILDREIPNGCYDTGEGFYNPATKLIYHPITNAPIRSVSEREEKWIVSVCRAATPKCVSLDEHLYEKVNISPSRDNNKEIADFSDGEQAWNDCFSVYYNLPYKEDAKEINISPDRLIQIDEKSRPVEELWDNVRSLTGAQRAKVGVPFSYDKAVHYTCFDGEKLPETTQNSLK